MPPIGTVASEGGDRRMQVRGLQKHWVALEIEGESLMPAGRPHGIHGGLTDEEQGESHIILDAATEHARRVVSPE